MNAFHYKGQPSQLGREMQLDEVRRRTAVARLAKPEDKRTFHIYSKAVPSDSVSKTKA